MIRIKVKADITTDGWEAYRIAKHPDHLSDLLMVEIAKLLKLSKNQNEKLKEKQTIQVSVEIVD